LAHTLTIYGDDALVQAALQAGAVGYLLKDADPADAGCYRPQSGRRLCL